MPEILYEDNHLIIVNKPFGMLTHGDKTGDQSLEDVLKAYIKKKYHKPGNVYLKSVHRLDRPTTGTLMFARTSKGHERMAKQFKDRKVEKVYLALTRKMPVPEQGTVSHYLRKNYEKNFVEFHNKEVNNAKLATTNYETLAQIGQYALIELKPETGRSHQLRVMLQSLGCPIVGDVKYNGVKASNPRAIMLHSKSLTFTHPTLKEPMTVEAGLPDLDEWHLVRNR